MFGADVVLRAEQVDAEKRKLVEVIASSVDPQVADGALEDLIFGLDLLEHLVAHTAVSLLGVKLSTPAALGVSLLPRVHGLLPGGLSAAGVALDAMEPEDAGNGLADGPRMESKMD
eukprot:394634-Hanusia_phi.AAC.2